MDQSHPKTPTTYVLPASITFAGLCIFGAGLVSQEPLEKIAIRKSQTIIIENRMIDPLVIPPNRP